MATKNAPSEHPRYYFFHNVPNYCEGLQKTTNGTQEKIDSPIVLDQSQIP